MIPETVALLIVYATWDLTCRLLNTNWFKDVRARQDAEKATKRINNLEALVGELIAEKDKQSLMPMVLNRSDN